MGERTAAVEGVPWCCRQPGAVRLRVRRWRQGLRQRRRGGRAPAARARGCGCCRAARPRLSCGAAGNRRSGHSRSSPARGQGRTRGTHVKRRSSPTTQHAAARHNASNKARAAATHGATRAHARITHRRSRNPRTARHARNACMRSPVHAARAHLMHPPLVTSRYSLPAASAAMRVCLECCGRREPSATKI